MKTVSDDGRETKHTLERKLLDLSKIKLKIIGVVVFVVCGGGGGGGCGSVSACGDNVNQRIFLRSENVSGSLCGGYGSEYRS